MKLETRLDRLSQKWWKARESYSKAMVAKDRESGKKMLQKMEQIKREQVVLVAESLGFTVEFPEDMKRVDLNKFYLKKRRKYRAVAFFNGGRLRSIVKTKRPDTMRWSYLINGQAHRGCENIYWHN